jgi:hypothetical protein
VGQLEQWVEEAAVKGKRNVRLSGIDKEAVSTQLRADMVSIIRCPLANPAHQRPICPGSGLGGEGLEHIRQLHKDVKAVERNSQDGGEDGRAGLELGLKRVVMLMGGPDLTVAVEELPAGLFPQLGDWELLLSIFQ